MSGQNWQANNLFDGTWGDTLFSKDSRDYLPMVGFVTVVAAVAVGGLLAWIASLPYP